MRNDLLRLLELQGIDSQIDELDQSKEEYPARIEALQEGLLDTQARIQSQQEQLEELEKRRRHHERELAHVEEELKRHRARLYEVKTNKEYDAIQQEIQAWENSKDQNEALIIGLLEQIEELGAQVEEAEHTFQAVQAGKTHQIEEMQTKLDSASIEVEAHWKRRDELAATIQARLLRTYERIRKGRRGGVAIVPLTREACGGCFSRLTPQKVAEAKRLDRMIRCENCGRIIVCNEDTE